MKVKDLINKLKTYDENCIVTINCPNTETTRDIWYVEKDVDPEYSNYIDIVMEDNDE
jgi:hypothetical protein